MRKVYADFAEYRDGFGGGMAEAEYERWAPRAADYLDAVTFGRADRELDCVRRAACALADDLRLNAGGGGVAGESNDGVRVDYVVSVSIAKTEDQRLLDTARGYLAGTGLLYRGIRGG